MPMERFLRVYYVLGSFEVCDYEIVEFETEEEREEYYDDPFYFFYPAADFLIDEKLVNMLGKISRTVEKELDS